MPNAVSPSQCRRNGDKNRPTRTSNPSENQLDPTLVTSCRLFILFIHRQLFSIRVDSTATLICLADFLRLLPAKAAAQSSPTPASRYCPDVDSATRSQGNSTAEPRPLQSPPPTAPAKSLSIPQTWPPGQTVFPCAYSWFRSTGRPAVFPASSCGRPNFAPPPPVAVPHPPVCQETRRFFSSRRWNPQANPHSEPKETQDCPVAPQSNSPHVPTTSHTMKSRPQ